MPTYVRRSSKGCLISLMFLILMSPLRCLPLMKTRLLSIIAGRTPSLAREDLSPLLQSLNEYVKTLDGNIFQIVSNLSAGGRLADLS